MITETAIEHEIHAQSRSRFVDAAIAALAGRQHGIVSRAQLSRLGLGRGAIAHRLAAGRLHLLRRGVYAVGHPAVSREARWLAAVLAAGRGAVLSHRSAAALWGLADAGPRIDVSAPRKIAGVHQCAVPQDERTVHRGIPVTSPPRTLLDLAAVLAPVQFERALAQAEVLRLHDGLSLPDLLARYPGRRGVRSVRRALEAGAALTRSELEERFLAYLDRHGLARPEVNARVEAGGAWFEVDCLWRGPRVIVELDGFAVHGTRAAFERDRERDRALVAAGWRVLRITWRQLRDDPAALAAQLRALGLSGRPRPRR